MSLVLKNPHSVLAALKTRPADVIDVRVPAGKPSPAWADVIATARELEIPIRTNLAEEPRHGKGDHKSERTGLAQATVRERQGVLIEELFADVGTGPGLWLALDCLQDPHNVGAIFRTASFFGVKGIIMTKDRSAPLTATVYDVAAGGLEYVPFGEPTNLARAMNIAKTAGVWLLGSSEHAEQDVRDIPRDRPWLLILGNEESGLRRLSFEKCDQICKLTPRGTVPSLNVSVAAGVLMSQLTAPL
ncbi:23S rRNA (guanosine(2251)-2'-O)-methyltransferase RlmB [Schlesneria paludicola]|uniref:23S rRNA (guanosine(2251)-2'-O)-methyltransferase RlmB n=1 Tax=Schlesneria paludicola TaxID=360056 RepID=UPI00029A2401|nr:RNA methyltransferase [Schlesneria paludicola]